MALALPDFAKGQVWKTADSYILITEVGKLLVHYRLGAKPELRATRSRVNSKREMLGFLERNGGQLVKNAN